MTPIILDLAALEFIQPHLAPLRSGNCNIVDTSLFQRVFSASFTMPVLIAPVLIACLLATLIPQQLRASQAPNNHRFADATNRSKTEQSPLKIGPVNVAPTGWRRTVNGWERAETWPLLDQDSQTSELNRLVIQQRQAVQASLVGKALSACMGFVKSIDPITLVCTQVSLLALYIALVFHREAKSKKQSCPQTIPTYQSN